MVTVRLPFIFEYAMRLFDVRLVKAARTLVFRPKECILRMLYTSLHKQLPTKSRRKGGTGLSTITTTTEEIEQSSFRRRSRSRGYLRVEVAEKIRREHHIRKAKRKDTYTGGTVVAGPGATGRDGNGVESH